MNTQLQTFQNNSLTANIRCAMVGTAVWFVAGDMSKALDYSQTQKLLDNCRTPTVQGELNKINDLSPATKWINESDLYRCIMKSTKSEAVAFQDWVCDEVLPSIRKTGGYQLPQQQFTIPQTLSEALLLAGQLAAEKEAALAKIEADKPAVAFAKIVSESSNARCVRVWVKAMKHENNLTVGEKEVFKWLVDNRYIYKDRQSYLPYSRYESNGTNYFTVVLDEINGHAVRQLKITGKGVTVLTSKVVNELSPKRNGLVVLQGGVE